MQSLKALNRKQRGESRCFPRRAFVSLLCCLPALRPLMVSAALVPLIPKAQFFDDPVRANAQVSPDGHFIAYLAPHLGFLNVWIKVTGQKEERVVTNDSKRSITQFQWTQDSESILYLQDAGGDENWQIHLVSARNTSATGVVRNLTPFPGVQAELIALPKGFPNTAVVALNKIDPKFKDVYRLNLTTGESPIQK